MATRIASAARLSLMVGLMVVMALAVPRYQMEGHATRETLMWGMLAVVAVATVIQWRLLDGDGRSRVLRLLFILLGSLVLGVLGMVLYKLVVGGVVVSVITLSQGTTAGLVLHAVVLLWREKA
ncbi:hypothetical protein ACUN9Y_14100 [Halomonas sp. V046]|uniref:hypothetical protein n=1 Tax=Halomonas sp. V046 TaxID=3459611 RepID=UPI004044C719